MELTLVLKYDFFEPLLELLLLGNLLHNVLFDISKLQTVLFDFFEVIDDA